MVLQHSTIELEFGKDVWAGSHDKDKSAILKHWFALMVVLLYDGVIRVLIRQTHDQLHPVLTPTQMSTPNSQIMWKLSKFVTSP